MSDSANVFVKLSHLVLIDEFNNLGSRYTQYNMLTL